MVKKVAVLTMFMALAACAAAQEYPKFEVFAGYSLFHFDDQGLEDRVNAACPGCFTFTKVMHGWEASGQYNFNKLIGVVADFSGHYATPIERPGGNSVDGHMYNVLFGPQLNLRSHRIAGYAHALFGFNRFRIEDIPSAPPIAGFSEHGFAWGIGGGFDVNVTNSVGLRVGQLDYILTNQDFGLPVSSGHQNNLRYSAGVVFRFGGTH